MKIFPDNITKLIEEFAKLPGVGKRTAQKYAYYIMKTSSSEARVFAEAIIRAKNELKFCEVCGNFCDDETCDICKTRDRKLICVVKEPKDVLTMEKLKEFSGTFHILFGTLSPLDNVTPNDIRIKELLLRVANEEVREVVLATNFDVEGEATALYIAKILKPFEVKVTRLAHGIPVGSEIEYADEVTLTKAFLDRKEIK